MQLDDGSNCRAKHGFPGDEITGSLGASMLVAQEHVYRAKGFLDRKIWGGLLAPILQFDFNYRRRQKACGSVEVNGWAVGWGKAPEWVSGGGEVWRKPRVLSALPG